METNDNTEHTDVLTDQYIEKSTHIASLFSGFVDNRKNFRWLTANCGFPVTLRFDINGEEELTEFLMGMVAVNEYNTLTIDRGMVALTETMSLSELKQLFPTAVISRRIN